MKQKIITVLNRKDRNCSIQLLTDYYPEKILCDVAESVFKKNYQVGFLFPYKTCTRIFLKEEQAKLCLKMDFTGPLF